ncbi:hypothetical protein M501DRAFT_993055 [Patellaria atrata CBS 101060]|uniref:ADF-H domain-containing protein n=1 Tax=Patellaria atrata CBS 101060 TaxID=1346257 RepID=A0A9P4S8U4_9PEZI|nr:hypothetical protein M501DRAFT_993055 [Patellaria atrata CBS 101060]
MSLNGLDDGAVSDAYQSSLTEAGGWFLLKYISRDAVEILSHGAGGVVEARGAIAQYEDKSPLYCFLLYRRRKVLVKYLPEGTSRLVQARVTVHFQEITEKFSPHDTVLQISTAEELNDTVLAAACSLHTATTSSSSSSNSKHKLDGISEDEEEEEEGEEEGQDSKADATSTAKADLPLTTSSPAPAVNSGPDTIPDATVTPISPEDSSAPPLLRAKTSVSQLSVNGVATFTTDYGRYDFLTDVDDDRRHSSQTLRPTTNELYDNLYHDFLKPKVKLGPRPSLDNRRPATSGGSSAKERRPVSSLPAALRAKQRRTIAPTLKKENPPNVPTLILPPPPPIPQVSERPSAYNSRTPTRPGTSKSLPTSIPKPPGLTPEKLRLQKALEMRNKRKAHQAEEPPLPEEPVAEKPVTEDPKASHAVEESEAKEITATSPTSTREPSIPASTPPSSVSETHGDDNGVKEDSVLSMEEHPDQDKFRDDARAEQIIVDVDGEEEVKHNLENQEFQAAEGEIDNGDEDSPSEGATEKQIENQSESPKLEIPEIRRTSAAEGPQVEDQSQGSSPTVTGQTEIISHTQASPSPHSEADDIAQKLSTSNSTTDLKEKRKAMVQPIQIIPGDVSEADSDDNSLMDELETAQVQEAMPMSVSKSPITPFFPGRKMSAASIAQKPTSSHGYSPITPNSASPNRSPSSDNRSPVTSSQESLKVSKKGKVSSSIFQRIQALNQNSSSKRDSTISLAPSAVPGRSGSIVSMRKSSFQNPASRPASSDKETKKLNLSSISAFQPKIPSPGTERPPLQKITTTVHDVGPPPHKTPTKAEKRQSISVTARIHRDGRAERPILTMPTESTPLELHPSEIIINRENASALSPPQSATKSPKSPVKLSPVKSADPVSPSFPPSVHSRNASSTNLPRTSSESSWRNFGRRGSDARTSPIPRSMSSSSIASDDMREEKRESRSKKTSRILKRMSSSLSRPGKSLAQVLSPSKEKDEYKSARLSSVYEPPPPVVMGVVLGELNVQFPDALLWKYRTVEIDTQGNIVFTPSTHSHEYPRVPKRFPLQDFRAPYCPDQDSAELPHSVILDFWEGGAIHCAAKDRRGQENVFEELRDAWGRCAGR